MKAQLALRFLLLSFALSLCQAQGRFEFRATLTGASEVPPNDSPYVATGEFILSGDSFFYGVSVYGYFISHEGATINGPAPVGSTAPVLFRLNPYVVTPPDPWAGDLGGVDTSGTLTLSAGQKDELLAGLWYVNLPSAYYPNGELRGQIQLVPEPATWAMFGLGTAALLLRCRRRT